MLNRNSKELFLFTVIFLLLNSCVITKVVTVPMRLGGAVVSIVPGVGDTVHDVIDKTAEEVDDLPF